jgi:signal transduction histidine kinase
MVNPNWEKVVGRTGVVGRPLREVIPELAESGLLALLDRVYRTGEPYAGSETHVRFDRDGDGVPQDTYWNFVWQPLPAPGGGAEIFVHAVEVTDQVRARRAVEEQAEELARVARALEASNRELDQFAYVASHDLKAPLRGIANLSQWIEEDLGAQNLSAETREHLGLLRGRVHRMEGLIDGILQYSRAGRIRDRVETVDTGRLVAEVVDLLAPPEEVRVEVDPAMPALEAERLPLQQVFMNLVGNAVKYGRGEGPRVRVRARDAGERWEFEVADDGPGIAPEYHERIFGLFQTLESRDRVEGTGIGLSIVRKLVESRGGRVWVESEPGKGSTFYFTLPRSDNDGRV